MSSWGRAEITALRAMGKAGWVRAELPGGPNPNYVSSRWTTHDVKFQDGLEQLAKRLGARQALWEERKQKAQSAGQAEHSALVNQLATIRGNITKAAYDPVVESDKVLEAYQELIRLTAEVNESQERLDKAKRVDVPEPTEDEAFAWLMERTLQRESDNG